MTDAASLSASPELASQIAHDYQNHKHRDIVLLLGDSDDEGAPLRAGLVRALCQYTDLPDPQDYSIAATARLLSKCRMREYAMRDPAALRSFVTARLLEAAQMAAPAAPAPAQAVAAEDHDQAELARTDPAAGHQCAATQIRPVAGETVAPGPISRQEPASDQNPAPQHIDAPRPASRPAGVSAMRIFPEASGAPSMNEPAHLPLGMPALLVPPPSALSAPDLLGRWITGQPLDESSFAIGFESRHESFGLELIELEAEVMSAPSIWLDRYHGTLRRRAAQDYEAGRNAEAILRQMGAEFPDLDISDNEVLRGFRDSLATVLRGVFPERVQALESHGAILRAPGPLSGLLRAVQRIETGWLSEFGGQLEGPAQNILGTPCPDGAFAPGYAFRLGIFMHLTLGLQLQDALLEASLDIRHALILRQITPEFGDISPGLTTQMLITDCAVPLAGYSKALRDAKKESGLTI